MRLSYLLLFLVGILAFGRPASADPLSTDKFHLLIDHLKYRLNDSMLLEGRRLWWEDISDTEVHLIAERIDGLESRRVFRLEEDGSIYVEDRSAGHDALAGTQEMLSKYLRGANVKRLRVGTRELSLVVNGVLYSFRPISGAHHYCTWMAEYQPEKGEPVWLMSVKDAKQRGVPETIVAAMDFLNRREYGDLTTRIFNLASSHQTEEEERFSKTLTLRLLQHLPSGSYPLRVALPKTGAPNEPANSAYAATETHNLAAAVHEVGGTLEFHGPPHVVVARSARRALYEPRIAAIHSVTIRIQ